MHDHTWITIDELARLTGLPEGMLSDLAESGAIPALEVRDNELDDEEYLYRLAAVTTALDGLAQAQADMRREGTAGDSSVEPVEEGLHLADTDTPA
jgi:hypothetical protein